VENNSSERAGIPLDGRELWSCGNNAHLVGPRAIDVSLCLRVCASLSLSRSHAFFLRIRFSLAECQCSASHPQASREAWSGGSASHPQCVWKRRVKTTERRSRPGSCSGYLPFTGEESVGLALTAQRWDIYPSPPHRRAFLSIPLVVVD